MVTLNAEDYLHALEKEQARRRSLLTAGTPQKLSVSEPWSDFAQQCHIRSGNKIIPFVPYSYQERLSDIIDKYRGTVVLKTRQLGVSEAIACKFLHKAKINPGYAASVLSLGQKESSNIARRIRRMASTVPTLDFASDSLTDLEVSNGGRLMFRPSTKNAIRSLESISDLLFDEAEFVPNIEEIYSAAVPSQEMVGEDARIVIVSTPSTKTSWFWQMFASNNSVDCEELIEAVRNDETEPFQFWVDDEGWAKVILHWRSHPIYGQQPDYLERTKKKYNLSDAQLQREYNLGIGSLSGGMFQSSWWKYYYYKELPPLKEFVISVDATFGSQAKTASYVVVQLWGIGWPNFYLVDQVRSRMGFARTRAEILSMIERWEPQLPVSIREKLVENKALGPAIIEALKDEVPGVVAIHPMGDKKARAEAVVSFYEGGNVWLPEGKPFVKEYKAEHESFPNGVTNDQIDATTQVISWKAAKMRVARHAPVATTSYPSR